MHGIADAKDKFEKQFEFQSDFLRNFNHFAAVERCCVSVSAFISLKAIRRSLRALRSISIERRCGALFKSTKLNSFNFIAMRTFVARNQNQTKIKPKKSMNFDFSQIQIHIARRRNSGEECSKFKFKSNKPKIPTFTVCRRKAPSNISLAVAAKAKSFAQITRERSSDAAVCN